MLMHKEEVEHTIGYNVLAQICECFSFSVLKEEF